MCKLQPDQKDTMNNNVQENKIMKSTIKKQWKRGKKANTESRKTSEMIAYISTRPCKSYQYECAMLCQSQISAAENSSIHGFKSVQLTPS